MSVEVQGPGGASEIETQSQESRGEREPGAEWGETKESMAYSRKSDAFSSISQIEFLEMLIEFGAQT